MTQVPDHKQLSERAHYLFKCLVERYIVDGQPVGSRTLARDVNLGLSPATIRNVMADLEDLGLISSPHTSAGRVPTVRGYRLFVDTMLTVKALDEQDSRRIVRDLGGEEDLQTILKKASNILSDVTKLAGLVMVPRADHRALRHVEFLPLEDNRVLVIMVVNNREVQNRIIHTAKRYTADELQKAANYLNSAFAGKDLVTVRRDLLKEMTAAREEMNRMMQAVVEMAEKGFGMADTEVDYVLAGQTNLMEIGELSDIDKLRQLFEAFNRKRDILHLLEQALAAQGVQIFIGEESGYAVLDNCSVVTSTYESNGQVLGVVGVIGPTRMEYERVIPIVDLTARVLGTALKSLH
jgi:heat-inducible transcriptional repressor